MKKKKLVHVGTFGQPQGLKGNININILTSSFESFKLLKEYFFEHDSSILIFKSLRKIGKKYIVSLNDCNDRDQALNFKGKKIYTYRENFPEIKIDQYYIIDLLNCDVVNKEDFFLGNVIDIKNFGAGDLIEIKNKNNKSFYIPMNDENLVDINISKKVIKVNPMKGLLE